MVTGGRYAKMTVKFVSVLSRHVILSFWNVFEEGRGYGRSLP